MWGCLFPCHSILVNSANRHPVLAGITKLLPGTVELFPLYFSFWEGYNFSKWSSLLPGWFCSSLISCGLENGYNIFIYYRSPIPLSPIQTPSLSHPHETFSFQEPSKDFYIQLWDFLWKKREKKRSNSKLKYYPQIEVGRRFLKRAEKQQMKDWETICFLRKRFRCRKEWLQWRIKIKLPEASLQKKMRSINQKRKFKVCLTRSYR